MGDPISKFEKHVFVDKENLPLIAHLQCLCPEFSKQKLKSILQSGAVWLTRGSSTNRVRRSKRVLKIGDEIHLYYNESVLNQDIKVPELIADEGDYSVWNKPQGMFSQATKWGDANSICRWVETHGFPDRSVFQVHRLDRATSGLIIVAHKKSVATTLTSLFENRNVEKHYFAKVDGIFPEVEEIDDDIDGKKAKSIILSSETFNELNQTNLIVKIETGRKHQIRKHLAGVGFPIIGDRLYNPNYQNTHPVPDLQLKSVFISFALPKDQRVRCYNL